MSLLRKAEQCFANQQAYKLLNAFVNAPSLKALLEQHNQVLRAATERRIQGWVYYYQLKYYQY